MYTKCIVLKMHFMLKGYFANVAFNFTLLWEFREICLLEILYKSSWSVELIYTLTNCKLFIPKADKVYFRSFLLI